tara:strand:- start:362 stop:547 length:186 start_codon:yes stop_codon:yes gene_type:complete
MSSRGTAEGEAAAQRGTWRRYLRSVPAKGRVWCVMFALREEIGLSLVIPGAARRGEASWSA